MINEQPTVSDATSLPTGGELLWRSYAVQSLAQQLSALVTCTTYRRLLRLPSQRAVTVQSVVLATVSLFRAAFAEASEDAYRGFG